MSLFPAIDHAAHFQRRVLQDALADGTAIYWRRRADAFEWARPRPGDFNGRATADDIAARDAELCALRDACLARASVSDRDEWKQAVA